MKKTMKVKSLVNPINKISLLCFPFIISVATSAETRSDEYFEVTDTTIGITKSISGFETFSILQCANQCTLLSNCKSFLWDPLGGICILGSNLVRNGTLKASGSKKLFTQRTKCRFDLGFELRSYGAYTRCCYVGYGPGEGFLGVKKQCHERGGRLLKPNSLDLIKMLKEMAKEMNISPGWKMYIGLGDSEKEGEYIWSDGQKLTAREKQTLFMPGEPNAQNYQEDCVELIDGKLLNDIPCWPRKSHLYACEMDI